MISIIRDLLAHNRVLRKATLFVVDRGRRQMIYMSRGRL